MPRSTRKPIVYPTRRSEYRITTPTGTISSIYEDKELAIERFKRSPASWRLIELVVYNIDITPADHDVTAPLQLHMSHVLVG